MDQPVVVTGANGLVGSHVCAALAQRGVAVRAVVRRSGTAPAPERACVLRAVRRARFSRFRRSELDVDYTYDLPRRGPAQGDVLNPWN